MAGFGFASGIEADSAAMDSARFGSIRRGLGSGPPSLPNDPLPLLAGKRAPAPADHNRPARSPHLKNRLA